LPAKIASDFAAKRQEPKMFPSIARPARRPSGPRSVPEIVYTGLDLVTKHNVAMLNVFDAD
jgi:hypothetical protein